MPVCTLGKTEKATNHATRAGSSRPEKGNRMSHTWTCPSRKWTRTPIIEGFLLTRSGPNSDREEPQSKLRMALLVLPAKSRLLPAIRERKCYYLNPPAALFTPHGQKESK
jgi:hypothetical protein